VSKKYVYLCSMKVNITRQDITFYGLQVAAWLAFLMVPAISAFIATHSWSGAMSAFNFNARVHWTSAAIYFVNALILVPWGYYRNRRWMFWLGNAIILAALVYGFFYNFNPDSFAENIPNERYRQYALSSFYASAFLAIFMSAFLAGIALLVHHVRRSMVINRQLKEEQQKRTEAELEWLKNQINPHFLFNTLNNISSLTQIDADKAQDSIAQLSDLLRYAMYETNKPLVSVSGEVEFMRNYIELMRLRCNERTTVSTEFAVANPDTQVAPLLFISLVENAFKHGVSSSKPSQIEISLTESDGTITFTCDNTNYPKSDSDRSGSGIGLENTRRRLELLYAGRYEWEQSLEDNIYHVKVQIGKNS
ncbi:MAG: sensor histidine kinase, partial [Prevotella sp.]|nr:sensor histidine kinase [Prevotella sp.]